MSGKCLEIVNGDNSEGAPINQRSQVAVADLQWVFEPVFYDRGDLTLDGAVDMGDMGKLSRCWQVDYDINTLLDVANDWLR